jgi:hypothetical protein
MSCNTTLPYRVVQSIQLELTILMQGDTAGAPCPIEYEFKLEYSRSRFGCMIKHDFPSAVSNHMAIAFRLPWTFGKLNWVAPKRGYIKNRPFEGRLICALVTDVETCNFTPFV